MKIDSQFDHFTNNSIPTPPDQSDIAATDSISDIVGEIMDNIPTMDNDEKESHES